MTVPVRVQRGRRGAHGSAAVRALVVVFALSLALFAYAWYLSLERPGVSAIWEGYYKGVDQSAYVFEARNLARGHLPAKPLEYPYGLGYPALAVPMLLLGFDRDPFAFPDAVIFATCVTLIVAIGTRLHSLPLGLAAAGLFALASPQLGFMVYPWSNTVTVLAVLAAVAAATRSRSPTWRTGAVLGFVASLTLAARYVDVVFPLAIVGFAAVRSPGQWLRPLGVAGLIVAVAGIGIGLTHKHAFGGFFTTPYSIHVLPGQDSDQALASYNVRNAPAAGYELFVTGKDGGRRMQADPLLRLIPWAVLAPLGLVLMALRRHPLLWPVLGAALTSAVGTLLYLSFRGTTGASLPLGTLRYFCPWIGIWALLAAYAGTCLVEWAARGGRSVQGRAAD